MGAKTRRFDLLGSVDNPQTPLYATLKGFQKSISQHMGLTFMPFIMHDNTKAVLRREQESSYPYGYFSLSSMGLNKQKSPVKTVARHASSITLEELTNAMTAKAYLFPASLSIEFHFLHNDTPEVMNFMEKIAILGGIDAFSYQVDIPGSSSWWVQANVESDTIELPQATLENEEDAGAFDISVQFRVETRLGVIKNVPKINNEGKVTRNLETEREQTGDKNE